MTGIPGTESVDTALNGATRVLLRIAVLVGLVVCGWLLGTGISAADETEPGDRPSTPDWVHVAPGHDERSGPAPTAHTPDSSGTAHSGARHFDTRHVDTLHFAVSAPAPAERPATGGSPDFPTPARSATHDFGTPDPSGTPDLSGTPDSSGTPEPTAAAAPAENPVTTPTGSPERSDGVGGLLTTLAGGGLDTVVPVGEVLRLPVPDLAGQVVAPLAPVLKSALHSVTAPVLGTTAPQPDRSAAFQSVPVDVRPVSSAAPVAAARAPLPAMPSRPVQGPAPVPATPSGLAELVGDQLAASSTAIDEPSTSSQVPAAPRATAPVSCPPGPAGTGTVLSAGHAATLTDGLAKADPGLVQYRLATGAGGLPRCPSRQPSTSPD